MTDQTTGNEMALRLAMKVRAARFARRFAEAMSGFGANGQREPAERLMLWRKARPRAFLPASDFLPSWSKSRL